MTFVEFPGAAAIKDAPEVFVLGSSQAQDAAFMEQLGRPATVIDTSGRVPFDASSIVRAVRAGRRPVIVITDDYFREVGSWLEADDALDLGACTVFYAPTAETKYDLAYRARYADEPLRDIIVLRSGPHASMYVPGMDFSDNALALFEYLLREGYNERYELVWLVKSPALFEARYRGVKNVTFLPFAGSDAPDAAVRDRYYEKLCLAKWIFFTDAYGFCRNARSDQVRVQLWHGVGYKNRLNTVRCEHRYEYNVVTSPLYQEVHERIYGLRHGQAIAMGQAKDDWLFHPAAGWRQKLGVPQARRTIFWMPTYRSKVAAQRNGRAVYEMTGETGLPLVERREQLARIEQVLAAEDVVLLIKLHPMQDRSLVDVSDLPHIRLIDQPMMVRSGLQINQVLAGADALISDYSSSAVSFLLLDRPMAFTLDDLDHYVAARGLVFDDVRDWLPGSQLYTFDDFLQFVCAVCHGEDPTPEVRARLLPLMHAHQDDQSARRLCEQLGISKGAGRS